MTIEQTNLLWLKARARVVSGGSLSEAVDQLITEARTERLGEADPPRSVVGTIDLPGDEAWVAGKNMGLFAESLARPIFVHEDPPPHRVSKPTNRKKKRRG